MRVTGLDGREYSWNPHGYTPLGSDPRPRSSLHVRARSLLLTRFPSEPILEEVPVPGSRLFLDFYLPGRKLVVEVQGRQHFEFVPHFHRTRLGFIQSRMRDEHKRGWCLDAGLSWVELSHDETDEVWLSRFTY